MKPVLSVPHPAFLRSWVEECFASTIGLGIAVNPTKKGTGTKAGFVSKRPRCSVVRASHPQVPHGLFFQDSKDLDTAGEGETIQQATSRDTLYPWPSVLGAGHNRSGTPLA